AAVGEPDGIGTNRRHREGRGVPARGERSQRRSAPALPQRREAHGKGKPTICRWQARFMAEGVAGLLHDATRPAGKPPLTPATIERVKKGRCGTMTHDYKLHGTTTLFAALDVMEGRLIPAVHGAPPASGIHPLSQQDQSRDPG